MKKAIELQPDYAEPYGHRGGLPEIYDAKKDLDTGAQYFRNLIEANPENACAYYGLARLHIKKYELQEARNACGNRKVLAISMRLLPIHKYGDIVR